MKRLALITFLCFASTALAGNRMATVDGYCFLEGQTDHSEAKVLFEAVSPSAVTDSVTTGETGNFTIGLSEGLYLVHYSKDNYIPYSLPGEQTFTGEEYDLPEVTLSGPFFEVSGEVSGEWTSEYIYLLTGDVTVPANDTLLIHPGTNVRLADYFIIEVYGSLLALGAEEDSVLFTSAEYDPEPGDWLYIRLRDDGNEVSQGVFRYCIFEYGGDLTFSSYLPFDDSIVEHCTFRYCQTAITIPGSPITISANSFHDNSLCIRSYGSSPLIIGNTMRNNYTAIDCDNSASPTIEGNTITGSSSKGIFCQNSSFPFISENTITGNYNGIFCDESSPTIVDNIIIENSSNGIQCQSTSLPLISSNRINGNGNHGIYCNYSDPTISLNVISENEESGIFARYSSPAMTKNTIVQNGDGIELFSSESSITLNIVTDNFRGISNSGLGPEEIQFNDVWNNSYDYNGSGLPAEIGLMLTVNANGDSCDTYFNIALDPDFEGVDDYHLRSTSPCIDAGPESILDPDGTRADIGAFPYYQGNPAPPLVDFTVSTTSGNSPLPVQFTHSNNGGPITTRLWNFGDGSTSLLPNPVHTYIVQNTEVFTVSLSVDGPGGSDAVTYIDLITVSPATSSPSANFSADPEVGFGEVQFYSLSSGEIDTYTWDFGDGLGTSTDANPNYIYTSAGTYTCSLTVAGPYGNDTEVKVDYITILDPDEVVASFEPSATYGVTPATISFTNSSIGTIDSYQWDFGDSGTSMDEHPVYIYEETGLFEVSLVATGPANADTAYAFIEVLDPEPIITSIEDVPADQGLQVYLSFTRSGHDTNIPRSVEVYTVERRHGESWTAIFSGAAYGQDAYEYQVSTLQDSTDAGDGLAEFRVVAAMDEGNFLSESAWGYSVDNIAPGPPVGFTVHIDSEVTHLSWQASDAEDFQYFNVYRGDTEDFDPTEEDLIHQTADTSWDDPAQGRFYKLSAVDDAGNEGEVVGPDTVVDAPQAPARFALFPCVPNPFNPSTTIRFTLPVDAEVSLSVYDLSGRRIAVLASGAMTRGHHEVLWHGNGAQGEPVTSGVYFYRLVAGEFVQTRKMTLLK